MTKPAESASWTSWGTTQPALSEAAQRLLSEHLGRLTEQRAASVNEVTVPASRLPAAARTELVKALGDDAVADDPQSRAVLAGGQSYVDIMRRRRGDVSQAPDVVLRPDRGSTIASILRICEAHRVAIVTRGGGTSVVGGLDALTGANVAVATLDLTALDRLVSLDQTSTTATFEPGILTPAAEKALGEQGFRLGHLPQSYERASLGGYVVTRSAGQASGGIGRFDDLLVGARLQAPRGEIVLDAVPGSAAGPDLRRLVLGSEGTLGVLTELTVRVRPVAEVERYDGWMAPSWDAGLSALRAVGQSDLEPDVFRLSDPDETSVSLTMSGTSGLQRGVLDTYLRLRRATGGGLMITGFLGSPREVAFRHREIGRILREHDVVPLGRRPGQSWEHHRFSGPYLRDSLLDAGVLVETLETATTWSKLNGLYAAVRRALFDSLVTDGHRPLVGCHVSHVYPTGASLYFTVLARPKVGSEIEQWQLAKSAVNAAIVGAGGTVTHHHAVGTAHRDAARHDLGGEVGIAALRAVKATLDPAGIMNPGKLLPE